jgi:hypothetical protein
MSVERQPAKLATVNMRGAVSDKMKNRVKVKPQGKTGLLSPNNVLQSRNKTEQRTKQESERVIEYMIAIREAMSNDTDKEQV